MNTSLTGSDKKFYLVCYDIVQNRRRTRVMKLLKGYGFHVQKSVFECYLDASQLQKLLRRLKKEIDGKTDSIRIYAMTLQAVRQVQIIGTGEVNQMTELFVL